MKSHTGRHVAGRTFCDNCNHVPQCGLIFEAEGSALLRADSWPGHPNTPLCSKGQAVIQRQNHPERLLHPMRRTTPKGAKNPGFTRISWEEAHSLISAQLTRLAKEHSPDSVFFYCGDPKEPRGAIMRLAALYGSVHYGTESSTACVRSADFGYTLTFGYTAMNIAPQPGKGLYLLWGINPAAAKHFNMPHLQDLKAGGAKIIVVDPRATPTAALADIHLRPRLGTTAALAHGLAHVLVSEGLHNADYCTQWIHGFDEYCALIKDFTPERCREITGVPAEDIIAAARLFAAHGPRQVLPSGQATTHERNGANSHRAICVLAALLGDFAPLPNGKKPAPPLPGFAPWSDGGPPHFSLKKRLLDRAEHRFDRAWFPAWSEFNQEVNTHRLPEAIRAGKIRALLAWGFNAMIWPGTTTYTDALAELEFGMAVDLFYRPVSHDQLDLILPAATNFERYAPFSVQGRRIFGRKPVPPRGEAREDWRIALEIGCNLGFAEECFHGDPVAACDFILKEWGLSYADLLAAGEQGITLDPADLQARAVSAPPAQNSPPAATGANAPGFPTPSGKIEAFSTTLARHGLDALPLYRPEYPVSEEFPLQCIGGTRRPHIAHSKTRGDCPWLLELESRPYVDMHPDDAAARGLHAGDAVAVESAWGRIEAFANPTRIMPKGMVGMMHGWAEANVNLLIPREFDPISGFAPLKEVPVQVRPLEPPAQATPATQGEPR